MSFYDGTDLNLEVFPGGDLIKKGLHDLAESKFSEEALLVLEARPRLESLGFRVPAAEAAPVPYTIALYNLLAERVGNDVYTTYNAVRRRVDSFVNAYESLVKK